MTSRGLIYKSYWELHLVDAMLCESRGRSQKYRRKLFEKRSRLRDLINRLKPHSPVEATSDMNIEERICTRSSKPLVGGP